MSIINLIWHLVIGQFTFNCGGGGGDGGAGERKIAEDKRVASAIKAINEAIGQEGATAAVVDRADFTTPAYTISAGDGYEQGAHDQYVEEVFDQAGYDAAVAAEGVSAQTSRDKFAERNLSYGVAKQDAINAGMTDLNKERGLVERDAGFNLARQGLAGGSQEIDTNKDILDTFNQGVLKAGSMGSAVATNARSADDTTRMRLIDSVRSGLDAGTATGNAYTEMQNNSAKARDDAATQSLKGFFDTLANRFKMNAQDSGYLSQNPITRTNNSAGNSRGNSGTVTKTT